jgi:hypothetical protein
MKKGDDRSRCFGQPERPCSEWASRLTLVVYPHRVRCQRAAAEKPHFFLSPITSRCESLDAEFFFNNVERYRPGQKHRYSAASARADAPKTNHKRWHRCIRERVCPNPPCNVLITRQVGTRAFVVASTGPPGDRIRDANKTPPPDVIVATACTRTSHTSCYAKHLA